jgi:2'-hydroxyisoflavone reductase
MKLLILGGTRFLGRHLATEAIARGHEVTLFNRGLHSPEGLHGAETIHGDRNRDLVKLKGRSWDAVVDTCGFLPREIYAVAEVLSDSTSHYTFISSQSVYADVSVPGIDETASLKTLTAEQLEEANQIDSSGQTSAVNYGDKYGGLKALCEQAAEEAMPNRVLNVRAGLIVGPDDYTDRFTYWVARVSQGGEVLAPGRPDRFIQFIDVRDLAEWILRMSERNQTGIYNVSGLPSTVTMENLLDECKAVSSSDASFTWVSEEFLEQEEVAAWSELPLWLPESYPPLGGFMFINCDKAVSAGLRIRPLNHTVRDTLNWLQDADLNGNLKAGIDREREKALLSKWHSFKTQ